MKNSKDTSKEKEISAQDNDLQDAESRIYELGFHIDTGLSKQKVKELFQNIKQSIAKDATVIATGEPQHMELAYTISLMERTGRHDFPESFFGWIAYESIGSIHEQILDMMKNQNDIFRYIDLRTTKEAAEYSAFQHEEKYQNTQRTTLPKEKKIEKKQERETEHKPNPVIENIATT